MSFLCSPGGIVSRLGYSTLLNSIILRHIMPTLCNICLFALLYLYTAAYSLIWGIRPLDFEPIVSTLPLHTETANGCNSTFSWSCLSQVRKLCRSAVTVYIGIWINLCKLSFCCTPTNVYKLIHTLLLLLPSSAMSQVVLCITAIIPG